MNEVATLKTEALQILQNHIEREYGVSDASPIKLLADIAWDQTMPPAARLRAATALLPYCHPQLRAQELSDPNQGPELIVVAMGEVKVENNRVIPIGSNNDTSRLVAEVTPG